jgi:hypothetical protein
MSRRGFARGKQALAAFAASLSFARLASAATLEVGPGKTFAQPCDAVQAAADGDTIEIDAAGTYDGDVCAISRNGLTLRGTGGRAKIDAAGKSFGGKGTWVISGHDTTVENIEFSGAAVADKNGAGIRQEGDNLTVRGCYFHDNEDGILSDASATSQIVVEFSEFAANGAGDGFSHNMYIGNVARFTLRGSYSHDSKVGHLVKSRAAENYILYNRITGEAGTSSYEIDLPNGGTSYVIGNLVEQGPSTGNSTIVAYGEEGAAAGNPGHSLFVVNNTIVNGRSAGGTFVNVGAAITTPALLQNNIFLGPGNVTNQPTAVLATNFAMGDPKLASAATYDYELTSGSPCVDAASDPGKRTTASRSPRPPNTCTRPDSRGARALASSTSAHTSSAASSMRARRDRAARRKPVRAAQEERWRAQVARDRAIQAARTCPALPIEVGAGVRRLGALHRRSRFGARFSLSRACVAVASPDKRPTFSGPGPRIS